MIDRILKGYSIKLMLKMAKTVLNSLEVYFLILINNKLLCNHIL